MNQPPHDKENPFASPPEIAEEEADRYSPGEGPPTIIFAMLVCFLAGTLMMISGNLVLVPVGGVAAILSPILFFPLRIIWYVALVYFGSATIACAVVVTSAWLGWTDPMKLWIALPAQTFAMVLLTLLALPASRRFYRFDV
ncbi:hypothetical protein [Blastopirellula marina]|uniref:Uncharacterized protein n=1 Tax=Blastopirellula marina TaxID=124 RepID=A0A2S8GP78_9BACT|nr:hypothetical protein [Blastopirellula marina]PQO46227.1 hypothetical protein C5Y93_09580 [Blastopirellula marina]